MKNIFIRAGMVFLAVMLILPTLGQADDIDDLKEKIKTCSGCEETLQNEAEKIFDAAASEFNDDFAAVGNEISVKYCQSMIEEIFYHMDRIKSYHNFKNVFYLNKLEKLKENRKRMEENGLSESEFKRMSYQIEAQYEHDITESQEFIDRKVQRIKELCQSIQHSSESIQSSGRVKEGSFTDPLKQSILDLKANPIWQDFESMNKDGKRIQSAIEAESNNNGEEVVQCLRNLFIGFEAPVKKTVINPDLIKKIQPK